MGTFDDGRLTVDLPAGTLPTDLLPAPFPRALPVAAAGSGYASTFVSTDTGTWNFSISSARIVPAPAPVAMLCLGLLGMARRRGR